MDTNKRGAVSALNGTKTSSNLNRAFDDEAKAYTTYKLYANKAAEDGRHDFARIFDQTAENERQHASLWLGYLDGIGSTAENLEAAAADENHAVQAYNDMARIADEEGFNEIAEKMRLMSQVERGHMDTYLKMKEELDRDTPTEYGADTHWVCSNCGFDVYGNVKPERCPLCSYTSEYFSETK